MNRWNSLVGGVLLVCAISFQLKAFVLPMPTEQGTRDVGDSSGIHFWDAQKLGLLGRFHQEENYRRLPARYESQVRPEVWNLSQNSSGIHLRFRTRSPEITLRWTVKTYGDFPNMSRVCSSGLDLYAWVEDHWQYVNSAVPRGRETSQVLVSDRLPLETEFLLILPLYDEVLSLEIGLPDGYSVLPGSEDSTLPKPIAFYGTSITQGASASRPGLAYPMILSRKLNVETINLGFSGNGRLEEALGQALCEIDAQLYVIDCLPNSSPEIIQKNALPLLIQLKACRPETPILMVENAIREYAYFQQRPDSVPGGEAYCEAQNSALRLALQQAEDWGLEGIFLLEKDGLYGDDHEGTIDGVHPNDLGMMRIAEKLEVKIREILED